MEEVREVSPSRARTVSQSRQHATSRFSYIESPMSLPTCNYYL